MKRFVLAIDSFKGCLSSAQVEEAFAEALAAKGVDVKMLPVSDGGEGMLDAFVAALHGKVVNVPVHDPLMRLIMARYGIASDGTALIETSEACGLTLMSEAERNPMKATTYGVGELLAHALRNGCRRFLVGLGGSGTSDAGIGMLRALVDTFAKGETIDKVLSDVLCGCCFTLACDVRNPLYGPEGAAHTFARQKGATPEMIELLDRRARCFAEFSARHFGRDASRLPGAGAAGGLGYALMQYMGAAVQSGADLLLDLTAFDRLIAGADVVITGEGHADRQTLMGKLPERILRRAAAQHIPVWLVAGQASDRKVLLTAGFARVDSLTPEGMSLSDAVCPEITRRNIRKWAERL